MAYPLVRVAPTRLSLDAFAASAGMHPDLLRRLVRLGLLDPYVDPVGELWFPWAQLARLARAVRLHAALGVNYAALGLSSTCSPASRNSKQHCAPGGVHRGHEQAHSEVPGGVARRADQGAALWAYRGRR